MDKICKNIHETVRLHFPQIPEYRPFWGLSKNRVDFPQIPVYQPSFRRIGPDSGPNLAK